MYKRQIRDSPNEQSPVHLLRPRPGVKVVVAPPVHVHVLVVQITRLLFAVVARVVPAVVWVGARVAPLHECKFCQRE